MAEWRDKHRLREDDAVMFLVELFRIHQRHWDEIRRREIPSFEQFRADIAKLVEAARTFQGQSAALLEVLRSQPPAHRAARITRAAAIFAALAGLLAGYLIGRAWPMKLDFIPFSPIIPAARPHARVEESAILLGRWRNSCWRSSQLGSCSFLAIAKAASRDSAV